MKGRDGWYALPACKDNIQQDHVDEESRGSYDTKYLGRNDASIMLKDIGNSAESTRMLAARAEVWLLAEQAHCYCGRSK